MLSNICPLRDKTSILHYSTTINKKSDIKRGSITALKTSHPTRQAFSSGQMRSVLRRLSGRVAFIGHVYPLEVVPLPTCPALGGWAWGRCSTHSGTDVHLRHAVA